MQHHDGSKPLPPPLRNLLGARNPLALLAVMKYSRNVSLFERQQHAGKKARNVKESKNTHSQLPLENAPTPGAQQLP